MAKVFVKADLSKELPREITYNIQGRETTVKFTYPKLPSKCMKCGKWGHLETFCPQGQSERVKTPEKNATGDSHKEVKTDEKEATGEIRIKENTKVDTKEDEKKEIEEIEEGQIKDWKTVSEKAGRSPKHDLVDTQVVIATPSRFAALSISGENGEELDLEEMEDEEIEEEDELSQETTMEEKLEDTLSGKKKRRARQMLPRISKTNHRVLQETSDHTKNMKRGSRKHL
ncbi:hypothetical protein Bca52824_082441 [Brassica carinata]|uniref:CCHC-type domain-containing protein n=1 Tax=Brassica carinata TaxID=52824 RepID=A0A8X7PJ65_BRACI|nr:hypothetical protein Bca52824_082441 [Brassica carinata]